MRSRRTPKPFTCTHFGSTRPPAGTGLPDLCVAAAVDWARDRQASTVTLRVAVDNTVARGVYESLGFAPVAGEGVNARDEVPMSLSVR